MDGRRRRSSADPQEASVVRRVSARLPRRGRGRLGMPVATEQLVERIWARDPTVWTGSGEEKWLGWLDEPQRMRERIGDPQGVADEGGAPGGIDTLVLLGMGGSRLAPIGLKRSFGEGPPHGLDHTHPAM